MPEVISRIKEEGKTIRNELRERTVGFIIAGLGVVAGLAWNDAVKALIEYLVPIGGKNSVLAKFIYAFLISIVVVVFSFYIGRFLAKEEAKTE